MTPALQQGSCLLACVAPSPTAAAVVHEAARLAGVLEMELRFLHVGDDRPEVRGRLEAVLEGLAPLEIRSGKLEEAVDRAVAEHGAGLVVLGALGEEGPLGFLVSSVARRLARSARCSTLLLPAPRSEPRPFRRIMASLPAGPRAAEMLEAVLRVARAEEAEVLHLVQEFSLPGLHLALDEGAGTEDTDRVARVARVVAENRLANLLEDSDLAGVPFRVASLQGREGWEVVQYAREQSADLLVVPPPDEAAGLWDRMFPHGTELTLAALPCALMLYRDGRAPGP